LDLNAHEANVWRGERPPLLAGLKRKSPEALFGCDKPNLVVGASTEGRSAANDDSGAVFKWLEYDWSPP